MLGGKTSMSPGKFISGKLNILILPVPRNSILRVTASLIRTLLVSTHVRILKSPTAPVKSAGCPSGYGFTFTLTASVLINFLIVRLLKLLKKGSSHIDLLLFFGFVLTCAVTLIGETSRSPVFVGNKATLYKVAT